MTSSIKALCVSIATVVLLFAVIASQSFRLALEKADHAATRTELAKQRRMVAIFEESSRTAGKQIAALQAQLADNEESAIRGQQDAAQRKTVFAKAKAVPAPSAGVVDAQTSRKAVDHVNAAILRRNAF